MDSHPLNTVVKIIDHIAVVTGRGVAWLTIVMALLSAAIVILRKGFDWGSIAVQESVMYMHAAVFLLAAAYALKLDGHVRVDIFYRRFSPATKAWVNSLGYLVFLFPLCAYLLAVSWPYVEGSWRIRETSGDPGGIPAVFLLKTLIPIAVVLLALQGLANLLRNVLTLMHEPPDS